MGFMKTLAHPFFRISRFSNPSPSRNLARPPLTQCLMRSDPLNASADPDPGISALFTTVTQWRHLYQSAATPSTRSLPTGEGLMERLRDMSIARDRIRLEGLSPPPMSQGIEGSSPEKGLTLGDLKKLIRVSQVEMVKARLRDINKDWITYSDFADVCERICGGNKDEGMVYARMLDQSGSIIVLGDSVCLRPHQDINILRVVKAIQSLIPSPLLLPSQCDPRRKELDEVEELKAEIDLEAVSLVRRELWYGLGYLVVQTAAFMRLTFWELSWDVMEPICFYVTSMYFMAGYAFFLQTSREPSFEGFFQSRFDSKQKRLLKTRRFDIQRYNELRRAFYPNSPPSLEEAR